MLYWIFLFVKAMAKTRHAAAAGRQQQAWLSCLGSESTWLLYLYQNSSIHHFWKRTQFIFVLNLAKLWQIFIHFTYNILDFQWLKCIHNLSIPLFLSIVNWHTCAFLVCCNMSFSRLRLLLLPLLEKRIRSVPFAADHNSSLPAAELDVQCDAVHSRHHGGGVPERS